jgi:hypothetical protein
MNKLFFSFICISISLISLGQEKVMMDANAQPRNAKAFHAIRISHGIDLYLTQGPDEAVAVSASTPEYRNRIITEVENGVLKIYMERENGFIWSSGNHKLKAYVSFKTLEQLTASGGSDVFFESQIVVPKLDIDLSGGSDLKGSVRITDLSLNQSGGSDVNISGTVSNLKVSASGGSDLKGYDLAADICNLQASGGSDTRITVNKELNINASGGSDVYYRGTGVIRELRTSGSSTVSKKG